MEKIYKNMKEMESEVIAGYYEEEDKFKVDENVYGDIDGNKKIEIYTKKAIKCKKNTNAGELQIFGRRTE